MESKDRRLGIVKLEVFINIDSLANDEDCIEIDYNYKRDFINKDIKNIIENFGHEVQNYIELKGD